MVSTIRLNIIPGKVMAFYIGLGMQLVGLATVGICFVSGMTKGDYGQIELIQLVGGSAVFYLGQGVKSRSAS